MPSASYIAPASSMFQPLSRRRVAEVAAASAKEATKRLTIDA